MTTIAQPFRALGAANGFTFCRSKPPEDASERPISVLTLKESMAWYWLLKDFDWTVNLHATAHPDHPVPFDPGFSASTNIKFEHMFSETHADGTPNPVGEVYSKPPKGRAVLTTAQRSEFHPYGVMVGTAFSNKGVYGEFDTPGFPDELLPTFPNAQLHITWYTDDSCRIVFELDQVYFKFVLTNLPTTAMTVFANSTPVSLGTVTTPYGTLTGYDITNDPSAPGYEFTRYTVTGFTFTHSFFAFN